MASLAVGHSFSLLGVPMTAKTVIYTAVWQDWAMQGSAPATDDWYVAGRIVAGYFLGVTLGLGLPGVWFSHPFGQYLSHSFFTNHLSAKMRSQTRPELCSGIGRNLAGLL